MNEIQSLSQTEALPLEQGENYYHTATCSPIGGSNLGTSEASVSWTNMGTDGRRLTMNIREWRHVRNQVEAQVWDRVRNQVWDQVEAQVEDQVMDQVWDQFNC